MQLQRLFWCMHSKVDSITVSDCCAIFFAQEVFGKIACIKSLSDLALPGNL